MKVCMSPQQIFLEQKLSAYRTFLDQFKDEECCARYILRIRLGESELCPQCETKPKWRLSPNKRFFTCSKCNGRFYPTAGSVIGHTKMPLTAWFSYINAYADRNNSKHLPPIHADHRTIRSMKVTVLRVAASFEGSEYEKIYRLPENSLEFLMMWHNFFFIGADMYPHLHKKWGNQL